MARELMEELGVRPTTMVPLETTVDVPDAETHPFLICDWEGVPANLAPDEHDDLGWFTAAELEGVALAVPEVATLVAEALARIKGR